VPPFYPAGSVSVVDVRDVARAHMAAAEHGRSGERYLLGAVDVSYRTFWKIIAETVGARPPVIPLPAFLASPLANAVSLLRDIGVPLPINADQVWLSARDVCFDTRKARRELGEPQIGLEQTIRDTYAWYAAHGVINAAK
jgi:dihydroflavonol-4-reductase